MKKHFITGATGTIGSEVVKALLAKDENVITANRHPDKAHEKFGDKVEAVEFDFANSETFKLTDGSDTVFLLGSPMVADLFELLEPFVDHLIAKGAIRVVYLSAYGMDNLAELPFHAQMEEKLKGSNLDWRVARPGFYMQNFKNYEYDNIIERGIVFVPAGDGATPFVSARDVGRSIAELLINDSYKHQTFVLTGAEVLSYKEASTLLTSILGKDIKYPKPDEETYRQVLKESGAPSMVADYMIPVYGLIKNGHVAEKTESVEKLTGHRPETLEEVLKRDFI